MKETRSTSNLRPYLQEVELICSAMDHRGLMETVLDLAVKLPAAQRQQFLNGLRATAGGAVPVIDTAALLENIEAFIDRVRRRWNAREDGSFWDSYARDEDTDWDDYPPDLSAEQECELAMLVDWADAVFLSGDYVSARKVYQPIASLFESGDGRADYVAGLEEVEIDVRELQARYAHCVYLTEERDRRPAALLPVMGIDTYGNDRPSILDVAEAGLSDLPGFQEFLPSWKALLAERIDEDNRGYRLYLESVFLTEGLEGLHRSVTERGAEYPFGYRYWLERVQAAGERDATISAARETIDDLLGADGETRYPGNSVCADAAGILVDLGAALEGRRVLFHLEPGDETLNALLGTARADHVFDRELREVTSYLSGEALSQGGATNTGGLYAKALLIGGRPEEAIAMARNTAPLGWSSHRGAGGIGFAAVLCYAVGALLNDESLQRVPTIRSLLQEYAGDLFDEIAGGLKRSSPPAEKVQEHLAWAVDIGRRRIEAIVSNKFRGAYERAARVLVALSETSLIRGQRDEARELIHEYQRRFARFSAFRAELESVLRHSAPALQG